jgi:penicillin-binding protein 1A
MPYAIRRVSTAEGRLLFRHDQNEERVLVAPWVAAEMTDLLQAAVLTGTGRAAQIGRPVAGKTGTTSSNKDGWFIGFSSGLTTGVWMGRDDARPIGGLQGGTAPARAFHDFMVTAVRNRPVQQFETEVPMPDWQLEPEEELYGLPYDDAGTAPMVDADGNPIPSVGPTEDGYNSQPRPRQDGSAVDQQWLDDVFGREGDRPPPPQPTPQRAPPSRPPAPGSVPAPDPLQPRSQPTQ